MVLVETTMDGAIASRANGKTAVELESSTFAARWMGTLTAALLSPIAGASRSIIFATALVMPVLAVCAVGLLRGTAAQQLPRAARAGEVGVLVRACAFAFLRNIMPTEEDNWTAFLTSNASARNYTLTSSAGSIAAVLTSIIFRNR